MSGPPPTPAPRGSGDDALAELNVHLGRFLRQADELLDEWSRFGAGVRARLDEQLHQIESAFAQGADAAAQRAIATMARGLDDAAAARVDRALGDRVASLRAELERLERTARGLNGASATRGGDAVARRTWIAAIVANVLLLVLIALVWSRGGSSSSPTMVAPPPAPVVTPVAAPPTFDAAPPDAPVDASPPDAGPPDAAPAPVRGAHPHAVMPRQPARHP